MDKFLVSSPTQLSQGFDIGNDTGLLDLDHGEFFNEDQNNTISRESNMDHDDITLHGDNVEFYGLDYPSQESLHDIVPISNNSGTGNSNGYFSNSHRFQHSKNISLDGGNMYSSKISHQSNLSTSSMVSLSQDAPSQYDANHMNQSGSNNTLYSGDSIPQLSSSLSYQSFLDSPSSIKHNAHQKLQLQNVPPQNTPRRIGRNKSMSVSSCNNYNAFATPSRGPNNLSLSPVNLVSTASNKVGKTPHSLKTKGHSRSRSRLSVDATNNSLLMNNQSSNGQKITTPAQNSSNYPGLNPFYTPSYVSPRLDKLGDFDDFGTPLLTPSSNNQANPQWSNQGSGSYQQFNYLSPVANNTNYPSSSGTSSNKTNTAFTTPMLLKRNDTLDSIKIEDQDDDAFKQLGKAKSYTNFVNSKFMFNETKKLGFMEDDNNYRMLEQSLMDKPEIGDIKKDDEMFLNAADLSLKLASQLVSNPNSEVPDTIVSSNSTPGVVHSHNSPTRSYSVLSNNVPPATSFSVPSTAGASTTDFELKYKNQNSHQPKAPGIDLLLPQFNSNHLTDEKLIKNNHRANQSHNSSFTKSYPASIDLASIATSPMNSNSVQNISTINSASPNNPNGLPTMATFSISSGQSTHATPETFIPSPQDLKLPIKVSDKTDVIDPKKKHSCPLCQARFQRPEHVKRHLKSHSSEKPYECDEPNCGKRFNRKDNLKAHLKKIHHRKL